jgi:hypothetical protein
VVVGPLFPSVTPAEQKRITDSVQAAIETSRRSLVEKCWQPSFEKAKEPASIDLAWKGTIGVDGKPTDPRIIDDGRRPDVAECVRATHLAISVDPPPSSPVLVKVELRLP